MSHHPRRTSARFWQLTIAIGVASLCAPAAALAGPPPGPPPLPGSGVPGQSASESAPASVHRIATTATLARDGKTVQVGFDCAHPGTAGLRLGTGGHSWHLVAQGFDCRATRAALTFALPANAAAALGHPGRAVSATLFVHRGSASVRLTPTFERATAARAANVPPVSAANLPYWSSGDAVCGFSGTGPFVYATPPAEDAPPANNWMSEYYQSGLWIWDGTHNQWVAFNYGRWSQSNPYNLDAWNHGLPLIELQSYSIPWHNVYVYTWAQVKFNYSTSWDNVSWGIGGTTYSRGSYYLRNDTNYFVGEVNGGCYFP